MLPVPPHDRCGRFKPDVDAATLVDISALGGNSTDDILSGQYRCHVAATLTGRLSSQAIVGVNCFSIASLQFTRVIPEIDIWRAANLMLKRYGEKAFEESSTRPTSSRPTAITMAPPAICYASAKCQLATPDQNAPIAPNRAQNRAFMEAH